MNYIKKTMLFVSLVVLVGILFGCNHKVNNENVDGYEQQAGEISSSFRDMQLYLDDYYRRDFFAKEVGKIDSGMYRNYFWYLGVQLNDKKELVRGKNGNYTIFLYDANTLNEKTISFKPADIGISSDMGYITGMDFSDDGHFMFRWATYFCDNELYTQEADQIIFTDLQGNNEIIDFYEIFQELCIESYETEILPLWPLEKCHALQNNYIWINCSSRNRFCLFDKQGTLLAEIKVNKGQVFMDPFFSDSNELILPTRNEKEGTITLQIFNGKDNTFWECGTINDENSGIQRFYGLKENIVYYYTDRISSDIINCLIACDISSGEQKIILDLDMNGLKEYQVDGFMRPDELWVMRLAKDESEWIVTTSKESTSQNETVQVVDCVGGCNQLKQCATASSMDSLAWKYQYIEVIDKEAKEQLMLELIQGKGPDIMFLPMDDFYNLAELGLLLEWNQLNGVDSLDRVLPAALEIGQIDNVQLGLPVGIKAETMSIESSFDINEWTLETIVDLMESNKVTGALHTPYYFAKEYLTPELTVRILIESILQKGGLIEWDAQKAHFDDTCFVKLIENTKKDISDETALAVNGNNLDWVYLCNYIHLMNFFATVNNGQQKIMGYPNSRESYLIPEYNGVVVINRNIDDTEKITFFVNNLMDVKIQLNSQNACLGILKTNIDDFKHVDYNGNIFYFGSFDLKEYKEETLIDIFEQAESFLEDCKPGANSYLYIKNIISEELQSMYSSGYEADAAAGYINNRIDLYLQETR